MSGGKWSLRPGRGAIAAIALLAVGVSQSTAQTAAPAQALPASPNGRWIGTGVQVDWQGNPLEVSRIALEFDPDGVGRIDYQSLGCSGVLNPIGSANGALEYREMVTTGADKCVSGAFVSLRPAGDRWLYNWAVQSDWLQPDALHSMGLPAQVGTAPDGQSVRSGVLTADPTPGHGFAPRDPNASADARAAHIEHNMLPAVVVSGEAIEPVSLSDRMSALHVPGVSVAVIHSGRIDWARAYGVARPDGARATTETLFQAASISKPVTALATLTLAQRRLVDLDVDVETYLNGWRLPRDPDATARQITLRELLNHTGGLTVHGFAGYPSNAPLPTLDQILAGTAPANSAAVSADTAPGVLWRYSGGGYVLIRKALENVTHQPFAELARRNVLVPAGMAHSTFAQPLPAQLSSVAAAPYGGDGQPLREGAHVYPEVTPDGLWTTPTDLAQMVIMVQHALEGRSDGVLTPQLAREMLEPGGLANWGLGWGVGGVGDASYFWHSGSNAGFKSMLFAYRNGEGVVIMTNADGGYRMAAELARTIAYEYGWRDFRPYEIAPVALSAQQLDHLVGRYRVGRYAMLVITRQGDRLFAEIPGNAPFRIYARSQSQWFALDPDGVMPDRGTQLSFAFGHNGNAERVALRRDGYDVNAPLLDGAAAARLDASLAARVASSSPMPASEPAIRRYIASMQAGNPDYATLGPAAANITRLLLSNFAQEIAGLGELRQLTFAGVAPNGADRFTATFARGTAQAVILCSEDGRIEQVMLIPPSYS